MKQRLLCFLLAGCLLLNCVLTARADDATVVDSGACGDTVTWTLDSDGLLKIEGSGEMADYENPGDVPWHQDDNGAILSVQIAEGVTKISDYAFSGCYNLASLTIPDSVTYIGTKAFSECQSLTDVTISDSVTDIGPGAFENIDSLSEIAVGADNPNYTSADGVLFDKEQATLIQYPAGKTSSSYTIPDSVTEIFGYAFSGCDNLTGVTIPDSVIMIGDWAFCNCGILADVEIPAQTQDIGACAFYGCDALVDMTIPDSVTRIGKQAFSYCQQLERVSIPKSVSNIEQGAFNASPSLNDIAVDNENTAYSSVNGVLFDKEQATLIQYPVGKADTSYTISDSVSAIGDMAFDSCTLREVTIPESVTSIGVAAFVFANALESVAIPANITAIHEFTFDNCSALASVVIPASVTSIDNGAFHECAALTDVYYGGTAAQWNAVTVGENNEPLTGATLYYNSTGEYEEGAQRTVTFDAAGGTVEPTEKAVTAGQAYGELPEPAREHYAFAGWHTTRNGGTEVSADDTALLSGDVTLYAHWTPLPYTVTWADEDGTVLQTAEVPYGQTPVYSGATPVKDEDELFLYVFAGWTPEVGPVGGDTAYTVRYDSVSKFCTVTWYNYNGEVLETDENVPLGEAPEYNGDTPERLPAGANAYVFAGWTPEVVAVSGDAAYMATYEAAPRTLTVTWVDEDGTVLETDEVSYGETPVYNGEAPVKATDERYDYEFSGWKTLPRPIRDDMTYEAAYTPTPKKYTITWLDEDDTPLGTTQVQYGRVPAYDGERPRREAGEKPYIFAGWTPKPEPVSGEATYKARYRPSVSASVESVAIEDGAVNATLDCSEADASLLCAIYNENDRLITLASLPVGEEKLYSFRFDGHEFEYAKVFAIDANARALCASVKCEKAGDPLPEIE